MKKLLALALIAGIPAASSLLSVVNPALAAPAQTLTINQSANFPTHAFAAKTRLCARTVGPGLAGLRIQVGAAVETMEVGPQEKCIERRWAGLPVKVTNFFNLSNGVTVFTS